MERVEMLREQARLIRSIAERSGDYPSLQAELLELAIHCEKLIDSVIVVVSAEKRSTPN